MRNCNSKYPEKDIIDIPIIVLDILTAKSSIDRVFYDHIDNNIQIYKVKLVRNQTEIGDKRSDFPATFKIGKER